jgi:hypothetical protein
LGQGANALQALSFELAPELRHFATKEGGGLAKWTFGLLLGPRAANRTYGKKSVDKGEILQIRAIYHRFAASPHLLLGLF